MSCFDYHERPISTAMALTVDVAMVGLYCEHTSCLLDRGKQGYATGDSSKQPYPK